MSDNYMNPINEPKMVTVPVWEYARLVSESNTLGILRTLAENDDSYSAAKLLDTLYKHDGEEDE